MHIIPLTPKEIEERLQKIPSLDAFSKDCIIEGTFIRTDIGYTVYDGAELKFKSPIDCSQITGLIVYYPDENNDIISKEFAFADAHGNNVGDIDHLFTENAVVKVILDIDTNMAFVQNADTNKYIEERFDNLHADIAKTAYDIEELDTVVSEQINEAVSQKSQVQIVTQDTSEFLPTLAIHKLTQEEYDQKLAAGTLDENALYLTPDEELDLSSYATEAYVDSKVAALSASDIGALSPEDEISSEKVIHGDDKTLLSTILESYILNIDYNTILAFDTAELISGGSEAPSTTSMLGTAILGQMILGQ